MEENLLDDEWAEIEGAGLFACRSGTTIRLLQPVLAAYARGPRGGRAPMPLVISLFGAFEARYGGAPVRWLRRRDMEIVRALLFRPAGASRDELIERFWPQTERLAAQRSLRTACSTIRKAIAHAVGAERVDRYFTAGNHVMLHESAISLDAHRFASHVRLGDEAFDAGRRDRAVAHYRAALRLHVGPPAIDPGDAPQAAYAAQLTAAFERTTTRLAELEPVAERTDGNSVPPSPPGASRAAS
jgi:DNA-binding SARP family transcriptional activator